MTQISRELEPTGTRQRLLDAAGEVFAEQGYRAATVREICLRAGANVAAVNYHFGDKEGLYREALSYSARHALDKHPIGAGVAPDAPPADRLRGFVRNYIDRLLDEGRPAWHGMLISREMVEPTGAMDDLAREFVRPQAERLREIVGELLGLAASDERVRRCACSVVGQCLFYKHCRPMIARVMPEQGYDEAARAEMAEHVTAFSLAALAAMRDEIGGGGSRSGGGSGGESGGGGGS